MSVHKRAKDKWLVVVQHRGQRIDRIVYGTKADAELHEAKVRTDLSITQPQEWRRVPTLSEYGTQDYKVHAELRLKASTYRNRAYVLRTLIIEMGAMRLDDITTAAAESYAAKRRRQGIKPPTINTELRTLKRILNFAREQGIAVPEPKFRELATHGVEREAHAWTREEVARFFAAAMNLHPEMLPIYVFLANTGCRKGEAIALTWDKVDLNARRLWIEPSEEWQPKSGRPREVPINAELKSWLEKQPKKSRWVFPSIKGKRFAFWPQRAFDKCRTAAGLTGGPHTLRHTFATEWINAGGSIAKLSEILGHSEQRITMLYRHLLGGHQEEDRERVSFGAGVGPAEAQAAKKWGKK